MRTRAILGTGADPWWPRNVPSQIQHILTLFKSVCTMLPMPIPETTVGLCLYIVYVKTINTGNTSCNNYHLIAVFNLIAVGLVNSCFRKKTQNAPFWVKRVEQNYVEGYWPHSSPLPPLGTGTPPPQAPSPLGSWHLMCALSIKKSWIRGPPVIGICILDDPVPYS